MFERFVDAARSAEWKLLVYVCVSGMNTGALINSIINADLGWWNLGNLFMALFLGAVVIRVWMDDKKELKEVKEL